MKMEKTFARELNWKPMINSLIFGVAIGTFVFILTDQNRGLSLLIGIIAFMIQSLVIYPHYLPSLYGYWKITNNSIYYYDYNSWYKRINAIFLPASKGQTKVSFENIKSYALIVSKRNDKWVPHFIVLRIDDGSNVLLDVSWNLNKSGAPEEDVEWVVDFITSKLNQKTVEVLQSR